jgi:hypothetical protein
MELTCIENFLWRPMRVIESLYGGRYIVIENKNKVYVSGAPYHHPY